MELRHATWVGVRWLRVFWQGAGPVVVIAALYTIHFQFEGLSNFCLTPIYGVPEATLVVPPFAVPRSGGYVWFATAMVGSWLYSYALFSALAVRRSLLAVVLPILFGLTALAEYYANRTGVALSSHLMEAFFESNTAEVGEALSLRLVATIALALGICAALLAVFWGELGRKRASHRGTSSGPRRVRALLGVALSAYGLRAPAEAPLAVYPFNLLRATSEYVHDRVAMQSLLAQRRDISDEGVGWRDVPPRDLVVVVVVGESARPDHFSINGYERETTPRLATVRNLVSFKDVEACATFTRTAVPCLMTRATRSTFDVTLKEKSVISVFNRLGFTTAWLSINGVYGQYDNAISAVAKEAQLRDFRGSILPIGRLLRDGELIPPFKRFLATHSGNRFVVLHT
ncbi:MAG TPA: sulfatase-like hydrolase/transferase, partial [Candidatus Acidoferrales bacterium]|nr:sulfatase-like hydrolase/transferase [Candidatus Acidoferrales bacterium]